MARDIHMGAGALLYINECNEVWWRDCLGDEVCIAATKKELEQSIEWLQSMVEELPE
jgi:hypothetical protein